MLTIDQVSQKSKERVIEILGMGVTTHNLAICAVGLASEKVTDGAGVAGRLLDGKITVTEAIAIADKVSAELESNKRGYAELALRIYTNSIVEPTLQQEIDRHFGPTQRA